MGTVYLMTCFTLAELGVFHIIEKDLKDWENGTLFNTLCDIKHHSNSTHRIHINNTLYHKYVYSHVKIIIIVVGHDVNK